MQHPLVNEAVAMGFDASHAAAALAGFTVHTSCRASHLSVAQHGDAFVDYLFSHPHEQVTAAPAGRKAASNKRPTAELNGRDPENELLEDALSEDDHAADRDYIPERHSGQCSKHKQEKPKQQQRKRLRRSGEAATATPRAPAGTAAAAAENELQDEDDPAALIAQHRSKVLHGCSSSDNEDDSLPGGTAGPTVKQRYFQAPPELDCFVDPPSTGAAASNTLRNNNNSSRSSSRFDTITNARPKARSRAASQQQGKGKAATAKGASSSGKHTNGQVKLDMFFTATPAAAGTAAKSSRGSIGTGGLDRVLSPVPLGRVNNSTTTPAAAAAGSTDRTGKASAFLTPAAGLKGPLPHLQTQQQHQAPLGFVCAAGQRASTVAAQHQQQQQQWASASGGQRSAPWWAALCPDESRLDRYDLVNLKVFGHTGFRPAQKEIVMQAVAGRDLFVLMPTGGGKSLCYQLPAVICRGVTVVVCPLLSLMQDQVRALCSSPLGGVPASFLSSQQSAEEARAVKNELCKGRPTVKLLYVTPEQLVKSDSLRSILQALDRNKLLARFVIDEAHCVSTWGHDFRPDYKKLSVLRSKHFKNVPITAVTATATEHVQEDIKATLGITHSTIVHQTSFLRPNLVFKVVPKVREHDEDTGEPLFMTKLIQYIKHKQSEAAASSVKAESGAVKAEPGTAAAHAGGSRAGGVAAGGSSSSSSSSCSGIIYCLSRKEAEGVATYLREQGGIQAKHYHAGMTPKQRMEVQNDFFSGKLAVIVATIAFGMGIDKPDVRFVVHFCMSKSLEGYYQEAGRAGRDGLPSECVLMFAGADVSKLCYMARMTLKGKNAATRLTHSMSQIDTMRDYAINPNKRCRHAMLLEYFGVQRSDLPGGCCGTSCDVCRKEVIPLDPREWEALEEQNRQAAEEAGDCELIDLLDEDEQEEDEEDEEEGEGSLGRDAARNSSRGGTKRQRAAAAACGNGDDGNASVDLCSSSEDEGGSQLGSGSSSGNSDEEPSEGAGSEEDEAMCSSPGGSEDGDRDQQQRRQQQHCLDPGHTSSRRRMKAAAAAAGAHRSVAAGDRDIVKTDSETDASRDNAATVGAEERRSAAAAAGTPSCKGRFSRPTQQQQQQQQRQQLGGFQSARQLQHQGGQQQPDQQQQQFGAFQGAAAGFHTAKHVQQEFEQQSDAQKQQQQQQQRKFGAFQDVSGGFQTARQLQQQCSTPGTAQVGRQPVKLSRLKQCSGTAAAAGAAAAAGSAGHKQQQQQQQQQQHDEEYDLDDLLAWTGSDSHVTCRSTTGTDCGPVAVGVNPLSRAQDAAQRLAGNKQQHLQASGSLISAASLPKAAGSAATAAAAGGLPSSEGWRPKVRPAAAKAAAAAVGSSVGVHGLSRPAGLGCSSVGQRQGSALNPTEALAAALRAADSDDDFVR